MTHPAFQELLLVLAREQLEFRNTVAGGLESYMARWVREFGQSDPPEIRARAQGISAALQGYDTATLPQRQEAIQVALQFAQSVNATPGLHPVQQRELKDSVPDLTKQEPRLIQPRGTRPKPKIDRSITIAVLVVVAGLALSVVAAIYLLTVGDVRGIRFSPNLLATAISTACFLIPAILLRRIKPISTANKVFHHLGTVLLVCAALAMIAGLAQNTRLVTRNDQSNPSSVGTVRVNQPTVPITLVPTDTGNAIAATPQPENILTAAAIVVRGTDVAISKATKCLSE